MMEDYSEITATLPKKLDLMNNAFNNKQYELANTILADINKDVERLIEWLKEQNHVKNG